jgi:putative aldouronate transport system substrate-binding protein
MYDTGADAMPVVREEVSELLKSNRELYNRIYGADNAYWMLQDTAMQLKWQQPAQPPRAQPREWTFPYTVYIPEYDVNITDPIIAALHQRIREEWGLTIPNLILAPTAEEFNRLLNAFVSKRSELGYDIVSEEWMRLMADAKQKLGL